MSGPSRNNIAAVGKFQRSNRSEEEADESYSLDDGDGDGDSDDYEVDGEQESEEGTNKKRRRSSRLKTADNRNSPSDNGSRGRKLRKTTVSYRVAGLDEDDDSEDSSASESDDSYQNQENHRSRSRSAAGSRASSDGRLADNNKMQKKQKKEDRDSRSNAPSRPAVRTRKQAEAVEDPAMSIRKSSSLTLDEIFCCDHCHKRAPATVQCRKGHAMCEECHDDKGFCPQEGCDQVLEQPPITSSLLHLMNIASIEPHFTCPACNEMFPYKHWRKHRIECFRCPHGLIQQRECKLACQRDNSCAQVMPERELEDHLKEHTDIEVVVDSSDAPTSWNVTLMEKNVAFKQKVFLLKGKGVLLVENQRDVLTAEYFYLASHKRPKKAQLKLIIGDQSVTAGGNGKQIGSSSLPSGTLSAGIRHGFSAEVASVSLIVFSGFE